MEVGKIAICAIGRLENAYAKEFADHYRKLGFDKLFVYDNNYDGEEHFEEVLSADVSDGFVEIVDWRNRERAQKSAYNDCYAKHGKEYDWIAFFDFDEFLTIVDGSDIHTFMSRYDGFDCLLINWMNFTDSGLIRNDGRPLQERLTVPMPYNKIVAKSFPENNHVKSIVSGWIEDLSFGKNPHIPSTSVLCCNTKGKTCKNRPFQPYDFSVAYLKHYTTKTAEEWVENKMKKGVADFSFEDFKIKYADYFFKINERTPEKEAIIYQRKRQVAAMALGRLGNQMFVVAAAMKFARETGREFVGLVYKKGKNYDYDYPKEQFGTVMRNVKYIDEEDVADFTKMKQGEFHSNGFPDIPDDKVLLNDYFQDSSCIDKDIALKLFAPYDEILDEIRNLYGDLSDKVCVNVRRGDYLKVQHLGFNVLSKEQIDEIIDEHFRGEKIFFVSDDIAWCKENFVGERYSFADKPCRWKPEMDLYLQTQCKANVISNSTFSWWGAFLNTHGGKVVCPWPWFAEGKINPMTNILPKEWIKWEKSRYKIWITYHKDELLEEYGLKEDAKHRLFASHKTPELENVNFLNPCWSEMVTMWYVWKNNLKSEYVGFNHYRRQFDVTSLPAKGECFVYKSIRLEWGIREQYARCHNLQDLECLIDILDKKSWGAPFARYFRESNVMIINCCFLMAWDDFVRMCEFVFPLLEEFSENVGCGKDVEKWREKAVMDFGEKDAPYQMRLAGFIAERLISCWIINSMKWRVIGKAERHGE